MNLGNTFICIIINHGHYKKYKISNKNFAFTFQHIKIYQNNQIFIHTSHPSVIYNGKYNSVNEMFLLDILYFL